MRQFVEAFLGHYFNIFQIFFKSGKCVCMGAMEKGWELNEYRLPWCWCVNLVVNMLSPRTWDTAVKIGCFCCCTN